MSSSRSFAHIVKGLIWFVALLSVAPVMAVPKNSASGLGNASCLSCHENKQAKVTVPAPDGKFRDLYQVDKGKFSDSVHADMECIACHLEIQDSTAPHKLVEGEKKPDCVTCHQEIGKNPTNYKLGSTRRALRLVAQNIERYRASFHGQPSADDPSKPNASCNDCHNVHTFNVPTQGTDKRTEWRLGISNLCGTCHDAHLEEWSASVHGKAVTIEHNPNAANCADCHTSHSIGKPSSKDVKLTITANCGGCHEEAYKSYRETYHGQITALGFTNTAKCFDCHGSHDILPPDDPESKVNIVNRLKTCQKCHSGKKDIPKATAGFATFNPHGTSGNFAAYPQIWVASTIMTNLLVGTFGFFWLHTLLWFYREYKERKQRKLQPHVQIDSLAEVPAKYQSKHFQRFTRTWRIAHLLFAISLMLLTLTGISLFYPDAVWAKTLINLLGGPHTAGLIHRTSAVVFAGVFFWHLIYIAVKVGRQWRTFKIFGPNSMVPGPQDLKDILAMFKWFFGMAPRPVFDRWTYWEKFDYWAPFWGVNIIGVSGLMMWIPHITAQYLPGWVFNVAIIFHSEEAFLAVVFLFTVHFFNNHFRPDKFPLDRVMFTGTFTLPELMHEHPLEYTRLLESGELESHLVDPPSSRLVRGSTVLGFTLITFGLILLTMVGIGFFTVR